jgi:hypothetical protein
VPTSDQTTNSTAWARREECAFAHPTFCRRGVDHFQVVIAGLVLATPINLARLRHDKGGVRDKPGHDQFGEEQPYSSAMTLT